MRMIVLYKPNSEHERNVLEFSSNIYKRNKFKPELYSVDSVAGDELSKLYGIMSYPAILVTTNDGQLVKIWVNQNLPLADEVVSYMVS